MSKRQPYTFGENAPDAPRYWTSLEDLEGQKSPSPEYTAKLRESVDREFSDGADVPPTSDVSRRAFMGIMGASVALGTLEGCRRPVEQILPYTRQPEQVNLGIPSHYATVISDRGDAIGLLVESHEGRPTKIEGNPSHPASNGGAPENEGHGGTSLRAQASILDLYDPDRGRTPMVAPFDFAHPKADSLKGWSEWDEALHGLIAGHTASQGEGLHFLLQSTLSPTLIRLREQVKARFPNARFHTYEAAPNTNLREGARLAFGVPANAVYDLSHAKVLLAVDSDVLGDEQGATRHAYGFAQARRMAGATDRDMNRLYVVEPTMTVTGGTADHRLRLAARDIGGYLVALAAKLSRETGVNLTALAGALGDAAAPAGVPAKWIDAVAADLLRNRGESLIVVGSRQPAAVHALAYAMNEALGNLGRTVSLYPAADAAEPEQLADLDALARDFSRVQTLIILGGNPAYDAPGSLDLATKIRGVTNSVHLSSIPNETSLNCKWYVPMSHYLEAWGDARALDGTVSIQQPLIDPLYATRSEIEILGAIVEGGPRNGYDLVRATFLGGAAVTPTTELTWRRSLVSGVVAGSTASPIGNLQTRGAEIATQVTARRVAGAAPTKDALEVLFQPCRKMLDGRAANNAWLQELPDMITKISWDNAALFSTKAAGELGIHSGDVVEITLGGKKLEIVAWITPGQADYSVTLPLGWGRTEVGRVGKNKGFDVNPIRTVEGFHFAAGATVRLVGRRYPISQTQEHHRMVDRPIAVETTLEKYRETPNFPDYRTPTPRTLPLWREVDYSQVPNKWSLIIDLTTCVGCNACVVACQAENNIPCVGKEQVSRGREMHWLRIDRYFVSPTISRDGYPSDADPSGETDPLMALAPVACQQCEEAPCENVCPVNATAHSPEGLNDMAYNRCIGTRYCSNNCPYKVRRFNYLNFHNDSVYQPQDPDVPESVKMQHNPNVTVRFRGVMEKCTYCVQRIQEGKIKAKNEYRAVRDGEIKTACQQSCSMGSISFGNLNDRNSAVARLARTDRHYRLLAELGTQPRTMYLAKIRNPNSEMHG